jgi:hypothetical protein
MRSNINRRVAILYQYEALTRPDVAKVWWYWRLNTTNVSCKLRSSNNQSRVVYYVNISFHKNIHMDSYIQQPSWNYYYDTVVQPSRFLRLLFCPNVSCFSSLTLHVSCWCVTGAQVLRSLPRSVWRPWLQDSTLNSSTSLSPSSTGQWPGSEVILSSIWSNEL